MTPEDQAKAKGVVDLLLPLVVHTFSDLGAEHLEQDRRAGELGMVLEYILLAADEEGIALPVDQVRAAGECLAVPNMAPPGTDLAKLQGIVADRLSAVPT